jgi:hypothetical protein
MKRCARRRIMTPIAENAGFSPTIALRLPDV